MSAPYPSANINLTPASTLSSPGFGDSFFFILLSFIIVLSLFAVTVFLIKHFSKIHYSVENKNSNVLKKILQDAYDVFSNNPLMLCIPLFFSMLLIWLLYSFFMISNFSKANEFGDAYGALNTLFSSLAFAAMIMALLMQGKELRAQRHEFEKQNDTTKRLSFENTFFNMLEAQRQIVNSLRYVPLQERCEHPSEIKGVEVFKEIYESYDLFSHDFFYEKASREEYACAIKERLEDAVGKYGRIASMHIFDSYFRNLYRIVKFVDEATLLGIPSDRAAETERVAEFKEKKKYTSILRAQLSTYELIMLFYNSMIPKYKAAKDLYVTYSFFDNIRISLLPSACLMLTFSPQAFDIKKLKRKDNLKLYMAAVYIALEHPPPKM